MSLDKCDEGEKCEYCGGPAVWRDPFECHRCRRVNLVAHELGEASKPRKGKKRPDFDEQALAELLVDTLDGLDLALDRPELAKTLAMPN